jgi:hypothetical protein
MRPRAGLAALLALAAALAACGGNGEVDGSDTVAPVSGDAGTPVAVAAAETAETQSYRSSIVLEYESSQGPVRIAGEGEFQAEPPRGRLVMEVAQAGGRTDVAGTEVVYDGRLLYMAAPGSSGGPEQRWVAIDLGEDGRLGQFGGFDRADPAQALAYLRAADDVEELGTEEVRGAETTHYRLTVDLREAAERLPDYSAVIEQSLATGGAAEVPTDVWVDEDGRVRRVRMVYGDVPTAEGTSAEVTVTTELYDFGADVDVEPPPQSQVLNLGDGGGAGGYR